MRRTDAVASLKFPLLIFLRMYLVDLVAGNNLVLSNELIKVELPS